MHILPLIVLIGLIAQHANADDCSDDFVSRDDWDAREPKPACCTKLNTPLPNVFIKYTGSAFVRCDTKPACSKQTRDIQDFHMDIRGWDDTGYNFLVGEDGNVYVGRGWTNQGAHTKGKNNIGYGVGIVGDFRVDKPKDIAMNTLYDLIQCGISEGFIQSNYTALGNTTVLQTAWDKTFAKRTGTSSGAEMMTNPKPLLYALAFLTMLPFYY